MLKWSISNIFLNVYPNAETSVSSSQKWLPTLFHWSNLYHSFPKGAKNRSRRKRKVTTSVIKSLINRESKKSFPKSLIIREAFVQSDKSVTLGWKKKKKKKLFFVVGQTKWSEGLFFSYHQKSLCNVTAHPTNLYPLGFIFYKITQEGAVLDNVKLAYFEILFRCFLTRAFLLDILVTNFTFLTHYPFVFIEYLDPKGL